ncbi:uncharacterized protein LOC125032844 [Penaeus chinensis]|uniref:uncharacterized protein LOC125032844 n=1 Tax=Penaeus chinensis TaxID=139456 RepID=UPI001FB584F6|nr:uncharacterized protein LOC125032844 [Penaeus chinensis]
MSYRSVVESSLNLTCSPNEDCQATEDLPCTVVVKNSQNLLQPEMSYQSCYLENTRYICMRPAKCPGDYISYKGHCFRFIASSVFGGKADFMAALQECQKDRAALAFPETQGALDFLRELALHVYPPGALEDTKILIGLNNAFGIWTVDSIYSPDQDILDMVKNSTASHPYRILTTSLQLIPALSSSEESVEYAACQLYGPMGCWDEPPLPLGNMTLSWEVNNTVVGVNANYTCYLGYFVNASVPNVTQQVTCFGQLGGWVPESDLVDCMIAPVCNATDLQNIEPDLMLTNDSTDASLYLNGSITFTCPGPMAFYPSLATVMTVNCTYNQSSDAYRFEPYSLELCDVCRLTPVVYNATTTWNENMTYVVNDTVNITCTENKVFSLGFDRKEILCTKFGWNVPPSCLDACTDDPPEPGRNMTQLNFNSNFIGDIITYVCNPGHFIPSTFPGLLNETQVVCGADHLWQSTGLEFECAIICVQDPVTPPPPATLSWDSQNRTYGTEALLECPDGLRFADGSTNMSLTCKEDGNWTQPDEEILLCRIRADEPPENITGASLEGPDPPHWKDTLLNYTCNDGWLTTLGEKQTTVMFNGTTWVMDDPDFECWKVAEGPPDNITDATLRGPDPPYWKTVTLNYTCNEGYLTTEGEDWTNVTFNGTAWVLGDEDFACWKTCDEDPVSPPYPATLTWEGQKRTYMTKVLLECPDGLRFADESTNVSLTCKGDGNWTQPEEEVIICRIRADEPPENITGTRSSTTPVMMAG